MVKLSKYKMKKILQDRNNGFSIGVLSYRYDITLSRLVYLFQKQAYKNINDKWVLK